MFLVICYLSSLSVSWPSDMNECFTAFKLDRQNHTHITHIAVQLRLVKPVHLSPAVCFQLFGILPFRSTASLSPLGSHESEHTSPPTLANTWEQEHTHSTPAEVQSLTVFLQLYSLFSSVQFPWTPLWTGLGVRSASLTWVLHQVQGSWSRRGRPPLWRL